MRDKYLNISVIQYITMVEVLNINMKGFLSFKILCYLTEGSKNGQELAKLIAKGSGKKPSPGTIYPALKELEKKGLISGKKEGKTVVYSLTAKGKKEAGVACKYFYGCFSDIIKKM